MRATRAVIHLDYLRDNINLVRERTRRPLCVPVKADAYGHGALPVAGAALSAGAEYLAVATVGEGEELREGGITAPVLLLSVALPEELADLAAADLEPLAGDEEYIEALERAASGAGKKLRVHLKIDTGMGRIGCRPSLARSLASRIAKSGSLTLAGTATHLAVSDSLREEDRAFTERQLDSFRGALEDIRAGGIDPGIVHAANTGAVTFHNGAWFDMVRPGILLYGYAPPDAGGKPAMAVKPLMELVSRLVFIKDVRRGETVSYGRIWTAAEDTVIGTLPLGYGDGLSRQLGNTWQVLAGGVLRPLAGRICMDQCMVDLGRDRSFSRWDEVTIFGGEAPHAGIMASLLNTIPYEITCTINKRVPRVYIQV
ncbi:MAG: alanine racemase [Treponema sp.]|jgi:alanine racemase|nr:alanine racemase [Treponema sp.]